MLIFNSLVKLLAMENATTVTVNGRTIEEMSETIVVDKNATAGRHTATETVPPLAAIKVSIIGKTICICFRICDTLSAVCEIHCVKTPIKGLKAAAYAIKNIISAEVRIFEPLFSEDIKPDSKVIAAIQAKAGSISRIFSKRIRKSSLQKFS